MENGANHGGPYGLSAASNALQDLKKLNMLPMTNTIKGSVLSHGVEW